MNSQDKKAPQVNGLIEEALPSLTFRVRLEDGREVLAHLAGKLKLNRIRVLPGDKVIVELGPDGRRGRIIKRI
jgi:translation initiation factor IF-1